MNGQDFMTDQTTTAGNKGLAIAGGKSSVHVLFFGRNLYFS